MAEAQTNGKPELDPRRVASPRRVRSEFASLKEWGDWVNANCAPRRADDTPVLIGQTGPRKRATPEELIAFVNEQRARYGWPPYDPSNPSA